MKIAIDYDNTFTLDRTLWLNFINSARSSGHDVRIVTARDERFDRTEDLKKLELVVPVIYCRSVAKKWYLTHFGDGFVPDVWVDDKAESILENSDFSPRGLAQWRASRDEVNSIILDSVPTESCKIDRLMKDHPDEQC